jgi:hypothetical protein
MMKDYLDKFIQEHQIFKKLVAAALQELKMLPHTLGSLSHVKEQGHSLPVPRFPVARRTFPFQSPHHPLLRQYQPCLQYGP